MYSKIKKEVFNANLMLPKYNLVIFTWGNVSAIDRKKNIVAIKPSGVSYESMKAEDIVITDIDGKILEGSLKPSSDLLTHLELYKNFDCINGIVHTHSSYATSWAQAGLDIPMLGTTMADYFFGDIPCTRIMTNEEINGEYEKETGKVIIETFKNRNISPKEIPAVLVNSHGVFTFGKDAVDAVNNSVVVEECAKMALNSYSLSKDKDLTMQSELIKKHFLRKHGKNAYYGQV